MAPHTGQSLVHCIPLSAQAMRALQVSVLVATAVLVALESGVAAAPRGTYSYRTVHQASSSDNALTPSRTRGTASTGRQYGLERGTHRTSYSPVDYTPEVKSARKAFFKLYERQAKLAEQATDSAADGRYSYTQKLADDSAKENEDDHDMYYYYYYDDDEHDDDEEYDYEDDEEDDDEEESYEGEDDDDDDDEDEDEEEESHEEEDSEDSEEGDDSSSEEGDDSSSEEGDDSSSEEGADSSSEEWGESSSEEGDSESSEEGGDGEDSSSSSSSSEEDGDGGFDVASWGRRNTQALLARTPRPVTDTPEVKQEKRNFFRLYKKQAELSFNAPDH
ncbi:YTH domain-containing protein 1-like [Penaeus japonicus]|uniref:YTH domain-containing protein 1-like n=1 Tax=Penaeus japonicus TaxID=27405 RepID=UPI001C70D536|nr:YTH domain-containing protein 1-like [Penaeus japonicus]